jgi:GMP synthase (glutamine-hydrolysing)
MMGRAPRLLVVEGNTARAREKQERHNGHTYSEAYSDVLRAIAPQAVVDICFPADEGANLPDTGGISGYDGIAITGSSLNVYDARPEVLRQVDFVRSVFDAGVPMFGSCWGLQVGAVAAGGTVVRSPKGREIGVARKIVLTEAGSRHDMHRGKGPSFDAPAVHTDEVGEKPKGMTVTATNGFSEVQAAEIVQGEGRFWGVQYHPEFTLAEMAGIIERYGKVLIDEGPFRDLEELNRHTQDLRALEKDASRTDIAWRLGYDADILEPARRLTEIRNWIERLVLPFMSKRGRG